MSVQRISPFPVETEALPCRYANQVILYDDLRQPCKAAEKLRGVIAEVDQQIVVRRGILPGATNHRLVRAVGVQRMGQETVRLE